MRAAGFFAGFKEKMLKKRQIIEDIRSSLFAFLFTLFPGIFVNVIGIFLFAKLNISVNPVMGLALALVVFWFPGLCFFVFGTF